MAVHSFIHPREYTLRRAIKAWCMRLIRREELLRVRFYVDELGSAEAIELVREIVEGMGGPVQPHGRFVLVKGVNSWADIGEENRPGVGPRSRTIIMVQGRPEFVERVVPRLREEKKRRQQPGKRRRGLIPLRGDTWSR